MHPDEKHHCLKCLLFIERTKCFLDVTGPKLSSPFSFSVNDVIVMQNTFHANLSNNYNFINHPKLNVLKQLESKKSEDDHKNPRTTLFVTIL